MAMTLVAQRPDYTRRRKLNRLKTTPTGNYVTGGVAIDLSTISNPGFYQNVGFGAVPDINDIILKAIPAGYTGQIVPGTDSTTLATAFKVKLFTAPDTELGAGAFPASLLAGTILIEATDSTWTQ